VAQALKRDFALEVHFAKWEFRARYHMTASDAESLSLSELLAHAGDEDRAGFEEARLGYSETWGAPDLRAAIAGTYETADPGDILCFAGAEEGIYAAMRVLLGPDDHAVVVTPNYQSAETLPVSTCAVTGVPLDPVDGWSLDLDRLAAAMRPATKLVSVNFPNNPTGKILERDRFEALVDLCRSRGIWLFSDEVYRGLDRDEARRLPQAADRYERALSIGVLSKAYGLPGLRLGWIACKDRALLGRLERYKHYLSICNSVPSERLGLIALKAREAIVGRNRDLANANVAKLGDFFAEFPGLFDWAVPDGGCIGFPRYLGDDGVESFCARLVEEAGVFLAPASIWRSDLCETPGDRFRIGYGRADMAEGLAAMRAWLLRNVS
jgi:aspartate/methionine/tyrosine aminotransferase